MPDEVKPIIPVNIEKKDKLVSFRLDTQLEKLLAGYCVKHNIDRSKAIRELLLKATQNNGV